MQDGIPIGRKDATNGVHLTKHIYLLLTRMHVYTGKAMKTIMHGTGTKTRARQKHYDRLLLIMYMHLLSFTYRDSAPHHSFKRKEKATPKDKGARQGP